MGRNVAWNSAVVWVYRIKVTATKYRFTTAVHASMPSSDPTGHLAHAPSSTGQATSRTMRDGCMSRRQGPNGLSRRNGAQPSGAARSRSAQCWFRLPVSPSALLLGRHLACTSIQHSRRNVTPVAPYLVGASARTRLLCARSAYIIRGVMSID